MYAKEVYVPNKDTVIALSKIFNDGHDFQKYENIIIFDDYIKWCDGNVSKCKGIYERVEKSRVIKRGLKVSLSRLIELYNQTNQWIPQYKKENDDKLTVEDAEIDNEVYYLVDVNSSQTVEHLYIEDDYRRMSNEYLVLFVNNKDTFSYKSIKAMLRFGDNLKFEDSQSIGFEAKLNAFLLNNLNSKSKYVVFSEDASVLRNLEYIQKKTNLDIEIASSNKLSSREAEELDLFKEFNSFIMFDDDEEDM